MSRDVVSGAALVLAAVAGLVTMALHPVGFGHATAPEELESVLRLNVVAHGLSAQEAISHPRVHFEDDQLNLEGGTDPAVAGALEADGYDVVRWGDLNLYFGGASTVALDAAGNLDAAGDPRRGGAGVVVD